ncbi:SusC/RagA family TonB-linked outer membrane protein [Lacinutrix algicola]|uniref:SusC/RagA family TonB-linked outer membrane protein n=1 Tax=Lacinutrix algicola TaxID=342954 RepID=UPI0006E1A370|nr:SusC/RagA family TonB-linked outer membrane protein [Lacinutrix algicola]
MKTKFSGILTLLLAFVVQLTFAQGKTISGTISDGDNLPLPGVNVLVKGTSNGTTTDFDGKYSISANTGDVLVFSYVGNTVEETVGAESNISFIMQENALEEVVITALGIKRKPDEITTSNKVVKAEVLTQAENPNVISSLTGKVSGLQISQTNTGANSSTSITLRGIRSLTGNNEALIVIDNAVSSAGLLQALDPKLIESVNVIKGANGAALYGQQGGNGVIIVTTKKGSDRGSDKFKVTVSSSVQLEDVAFIPERQTTYGQGWNGLQYVYENGAWGPAYDGSSQPVGLPNADGTFNNFVYEGNNDNIKDFFQTGTTFQNSVSFSGGNLDEGYINFFGSDQRTEFIVENDELKRNTFNLKAGKKLGKLTVGGSVTYTTSNTQIAMNAGADGDATLYEALLETPTNVQLGAYNGTNEGHWNGYYLNPTWVQNNARSFAREDRFNSTIELSYELNDNINFVYRGNVSTAARNSSSYTNAYNDPTYIEDITGFARNVQSTYAVGENRFRNIYSDILVNFDYMLTDDISFKANVGNNITDNLFFTQSSSVTDLTIAGLYNLSNGSSTPITTNSESRSRGIGVFANLDFGYKDFLYVNITGRNDWTSVLAKENRSFFYPSAGLSFIPTKAFDGLKGDVLNYAKISLSAVKVGTADVAAYQTNATYVQASGFPFNGQNSFIQSTSETDPLLQNQFINSQEANINLGFFNNRITLDGSYYNSKNTNQILGTDPSYTSGLTNATINIGETTTDGYEIDLGFTPIKSKVKGGLNWDVNVSYATNKTIVDKITDQTGRLSVASNADIGFFAIEGEEFPLIYGTGYDRDSQGRVIINSNGNPQKASEFVELGKTTPDYILGLNTSINYKGFNLSAVMDYRTGHQFYSATKAELARSGYLQESVESGRGPFIFPNSVIETTPGTYVANTTVPTGGTSYADYVTYYTEQYYTTTENFIVDATAFKVRELSLSYAFPQNYLKNTFLEELKFGITARNPFVKLAEGNEGFADPESSTVATGGFAAIGQYPSTKFYGFNVNLTF